MTSIVDRLEDRLAAAAATDDEEFLLAPKESRKLVPLESSVELQIPDSGPAGATAGDAGDTDDADDAASDRSAWSVPDPDGFPDVDEPVGVTAGELEAPAVDEGRPAGTTDAVNADGSAADSPAVGELNTRLMCELDDADDDDDDGGGEAGADDGADGGVDGDVDGGADGAEAAGSVEGVERRGFLTKKAGAFSGTRKRWFVLQQGTLMWYKAREEEASGVPQGYVHLRTCKILVPDDGKAAKPNGQTFVLRGRKEHALTASSAAEATEWLAALRHNSRCAPLTSLDEAPADCDGDGGAKKAKQGVMMRCENFVAKKVLTSELGKKLLREFCLPGVMAVLDALKQLLSKDPKLPPKQAQENETTILKVAVKMVLLFTHSVLRPRDLDHLNNLVEWLVLDLLIKYDECTSPPYRHAADPDHAKFCEKITGVEAELVRCIGPHTTDKNLAKLKAVTGYFADAGNVARLFTDPLFAADMEVITDALRSLILQTSFQ
eukprot:7189550-Prymnesium_polylepis.1